MELSITECQKALEKCGFDADSIKFKKSNNKILRFDIDANIKFMTENVRKDLNNVKFDMQFLIEILLEFGYSRESIIGDSNIKLSAYVLRHKTPNNNPTCLSTYNNSISEIIKIKAKEQQFNEFYEILSQCPNLVKHFEWDIHSFFKNSKNKSPNYHLYKYVQDNHQVFINNLVPSLCHFSVNDLDIFVQLRGSPSLRDVFAFCPLQFTKNDGILLVYLVYQLLHLNSNLRKLGLHLPALSCSDIFVSESYWLTVPPYFVESEREPEKPDPTTPNEIERPVRSDFYSAVREWQCGRMSNYDYLLLLNRMAGRKMESARNHPIFPWVMDFESENGNLRDLTKSKYRLNKGDDQLDVTFSAFFEPVHENEFSVNEQRAHHIAGMLSDVTYYMYMARRTPKSILCSIVRQRWVPKEYPGSLSRLYYWTPDECIPEFYSDPSIFESIHDDLDDLEIPPWAKSAEHLIECHRKLLESEEVSKMLHHWIDITFGYKLTGDAALEAKNVSLAFISDSTDLYTYNTAKLFDREHPPRYFSGLPIHSFESFQPVELLEYVEKTGQFFGSAVTTIFEPEQESLPERETQPSHDWKIMSCLVAEIAFFDGLCFVGNSSDLETRFNIARHYYYDNMNSAPMALTNLLSILFDNPNSTSVLSPYVRFPSHFNDIYNFSANCEKHKWELCSQMLMENDLNFSSLLHTNCQVISKVVIGAQNFCMNVLPTLNRQEVVVSLPTIKSLLHNRFLALKIMPFCFDELTKHLSRPQNNLEILPLLRRLYTIDNPDQTFLKLYSQQFLAIIRRRLGDEAFLTLFTEIFVHTLAGFPHEDGSPLGNSDVLSPDQSENPLGSVSKSQLSEICENNIYWLFSEIGPVMSAVFVTRKLLGVMELSYLNSDYRQVCKIGWNQDKCCSFCLVKGDFYSQPVARCLIEAANLFGEQFITNQYFEYIKAMISIISSSSTLNYKKEAVLIGSLVLLRFCLSFLSNLLILKLFDETIVQKLLLPIIHLVCSPIHYFSSGGSTRLVTAYKIMDIVLVVGQHFQICQCVEKLIPVISTLLSAFNMEYDGVEEKIADQLKFVYSTNFAIDSYSLIKRIFGRNFLINKANIDFNLCRFMEMVKGFVAVINSPANSVTERLNINSKIVENFKISRDVIVNKPMNSKWLAYWTYQIGLGRNENYFDLKQIKLQSFTGHCSGVGKVVALSCENSFISVSRDKTMRMWSILDSTSTGSLWTYSNHRKPVWGLEKFENSGHCVSCDGSLHIVDYSNGKMVRLFEPKYDIGNICGLHEPSSTLVVATNRFSLGIYDIRTKCPSYYFRLVNRIGSGSINSISVDPSDSWIAISTSTGLVYVADVRSGRIIASSHSYVEIKRLNACYKSLFMASGADKSLSGWKINDNAIRHDFSLIGHQDTIIQFETHNDNLVTLSSQHRLGWYGNFFSKRSVFQPMELPADVFKGNVKCFTFLPRTQLILVASDSGEITLLR